MTGDLDCNELVELVTEYLAGRLSEADRRRFDDHLSRCGGCTNYVEQFRETIRLTGTLSADDLEPEAREALLAQFREWNST
jgi:anti-sigma factor RsiW